MIIENIDTGYASPGENETAELDECANDLINDIAAYDGLDNYQQQQDYNESRDMDCFEWDCCGVVDGYGNCVLEGECFVARATNAIRIFQKQFKKPQ